MHRNKNLFCIKFSAWYYQRGYTRIKKSLLLLSKNQKFMHTSFSSSCVMKKIHWNLVFDHNIKVHQKTPTESERNLLKHLIRILVLVFVSKSIIKIQREKNYQTIILPKMMNFQGTEKYKKSHARSWRVLFIDRFSVEVDWNWYHQNPKNSQNQWATVENSQKSL